MRVKDERKRQAIREATVLEVVSVGLSQTSIAKIAKRAQVSQGTIYLYFANKESLLQAIYMEIKRDIHTTLMRAQKAHPHARDGIRAMWFGLFEYAVAYPNNFAYSELISAAQLLQAQQRAELAVLQQEIVDVISDAIADGTLVAAPVSVILSVLAAPALHSARQIALHQMQFDAKTAQETFELIWRGIACRS